MDQQAFQTLVIDQFRLLREEMSVIREELGSMQGEIHSIRKDMKEMRGELKGEIRDVKEDLRAVKQDLNDLRTEVRGYEGKLDEVYQARNVVKIKFGWQWGLVSFFIAFVAASLTQFLD